MYFIHKGLGVVPYRRELVLLYRRMEIFHLDDIGKMRPRRKVEAIWAKLRPCAKSTGKSFIPCPIKRLSKKLWLKEEIGIGNTLCVARVDIIISS